MIFKSYHILPKFPPISISGERCDLLCKHCGGHYLKNMKSITDPEHLFSYCKKIDDKCNGILLSGGFDKKGMLLNLQKMLKTIKKVKEKTELTVAIHPGFVDEGLAQELADAGIDIALTDFIGSEETIREILGIDASPIDYLNTLKNLENAGIPTAPHICIGLHYGKLKGEIDALKMLNNCDPAVIVIIIFLPTMGTEMENCFPPSIADISKVMKKAGEISKEISLGCMRPRNFLREEIEMIALKNGITRMALPSKKTLETAKNMGYEIREIDGCCGLP